MPALGRFLLLLTLCGFVAHAQLDSFPARAERTGFSGVILAHDGSEFVVEHAFGSVERDTRFPVASITKLFTSVLVLQMAERDEIDLELRVSELLPQFEINAFEQITVHQLLTHTSGLQNPDAMDDEEEDPVGEFYRTQIELDAAIRTYLSAPLREPRYEYNNADYWVLGKIIETVTGRAYQQVLHERILEPLGLEATSYVTSMRDQEGVAGASYWNRESETFVPNPAVHLANYFAGGAIVSTADDVLAFTRALFDGELIDPDSLGLLIRTYPDSNSYGYGVWVQYPEYNRTVPKVVRRYGRIWGYRHLVSRFVEQGITVVVLGNNDRVEPTSIEALIGEALLD